MLKVSINLKECYRLYQVVRLLKRFHQVLDELHASCGPLAPSVNDLCLVGVQSYVIVKVYLCKQYSRFHLFVFYNQEFVISRYLTGAACSSTIAV